MAEQRLNALADRLEKVADRLERSGKPSVGAAAADETSEIVEQFDNMYGNSANLKKYFDLSEKLGGDIAEHAKLVKKCYNANREFLVLVAKHKQPNQKVLNDIRKPTGDAVNVVIKYRDDNRKSKFFNHLSTVSEGIGCFGWITVAPKPVPYLKESFDSSLFYGNRVIKDFKDKEPMHVEWMRAYTNSIKDLQEYVKTYHPSGIVFNPEGTECTGTSAAGGPPPPPPVAGVPPPPPGGLPAPPPVGAAPKSKPDAAALFAAINKGDDITKGLKKVTKDMQTHKNPELRASSVVKSTDIKKPASTTPKAAALAPAKKPPRCEAAEGKWFIEYQEDNPSIEITAKDARETVYIYKCTKTTVKVNGKLNSIIIDSCKRVGLVFETTISCVETVNSQSIQIQVILFHTRFPHHSLSPLINRSSILVPQFPLTKPMAAKFS
jgi:adenylyl cyclase-associated protein